MKQLARWILRRDIREYERRLKTYARINKAQARKLRTLCDAAERPLRLHD